MQTLRLCTIQSDLHWYDVAANLTMFKQKIGAVTQDNPDVIVLPEMFTTGFTMETSLVDREVSVSIESWFITMAKLADALVIGTTMYQLASGDYVNRLLAASPDGKLVNYDKQYLFAMGKEDQYYTPGNQRLVIQYKTWNILPLICYDLRFSIAADHSGEVDLILYTASWPSRRITHWDKLLQARAIENLSYVVAVNRVGKDGSGVAYPGHSQVISPMGEIIMKSIEEEQSCLVEIDKAFLDSTRTTLPFLKDKK